MTLGRRQSPWNTDKPRKELIELTKRGRVQPRGVLDFDVEHDATHSFSPPKTSMPKVSMSPSLQQKRSEQRLQRET